MLGKKRILMVGNEGVVLFGPAPKGGVEREASISWEVPDFDNKLVEALQKKHEKKSVLVLFDGSDVAFRKEGNIPKLGSMDRGKYIQRKLDQVFSNYPIRSYLDVTGKKGPDGEKPPLEYLFVSLTDTEKLDKITESLLESGVHISGVCILPIESEGLIETLNAKVNAKKKKDKSKDKNKKDKAKKGEAEAEAPAPVEEVKAEAVDEGEKFDPLKARWIVLAGQHEDGGLRQVIIKDGKMAFTRITPTSEAGVQGEAWANEFIEEFKATETYLTRLNYKHDDGLSVIMICGEDEKAYFESRGFAPGDSFKCLTANEALEHIGFKNNLAGDVNYSDAIYAAWMSKKMGLKLPVNLPKIAGIKWPRIAVSVLTIGMMLGILGVSYYDFILYEESKALELQADQQRIQQRMLKKEYDKESEVFKQFPIKMDVVKGTVAVNNFLKGGVFKMTPTLNVLRSVLPKDIKLAELEVEYKKGGSKKGVMSRIRSRSKDKGSSGSKQIVIKFKYSLVKAMPLEEKVVRAENLITLLRGRLPGYEVKLLEQFGKVSRDDGIKGKSDEKSVADKGDKAEYSSISIKGPAL